MTKRELFESLGREWEIEELEAMYRLPSEPPQWPYFLSLASLAAACALLLLVLG